MLAKVDVEVSDIQNKGIKDKHFRFFFFLNLKTETTNIRKVKCKAGSSTESQSDSPILHWSQTIPKLN